jgi:hypothetical protein
MTSRPASSSGTSAPDRRGFRIAARASARSSGGQFQFRMSCPSPWGVRNEPQPITTESHRR